MGKIVKYCAVCDESFSDRFSFCPNCASALTAYELNPVMPEQRNTEPVKVFEPTAEETVEKFEPVTAQFTAPVEQDTVETNFEPQQQSYFSDVVSEDANDILEIKEEVVEKPFITAPAVIIPPAATQSFEDYQQTYSSASNKTYQSSFANESYSNTKKPDDDGFYTVTLVEEKDRGTRNLLLLGSTALVLGVAIFGMIYSLYNADAYVGALDDDIYNIVYAPTDEPTEMEEEKPPPAEKNKEAGGGGGGNKNPLPVSKGKLANQVEKPDVPPSVTLTPVTKPEIPLTVGVKGPEKKQPPSNDPYGNPQSKFNVASDGDGEGGGQGRGKDGGQGDGQGPGYRNGSGGGPGGNGPGGPGGTKRNIPDDDDTAGGPPTIKRGETKAMQITFKPRPNYTDAARQAQVQGTVTLRVTFNANGSIGSISPVSGLPNGLTEQAIAAARNIRFTPAMKDGQPQTVVKQVQYSFTLY